MIIHAPASKVLAKEGRVTGVRTKVGVFDSNRVILATGGASYPETGSSGDGYPMVRSLGHTIQPLRPSLVPLVTREAFVKELQGLSLKNVRATLLSEGRKLEEEFGEMLFTHFGVSGPIILTLSGAAVDEMAKGKVELAIDLKPALSPEQVEARLLREFQDQPRKQIANIFFNLLPRRLGSVFLQRAGIPGEVKGREVRSGERKRLVHFLKDWRLTLLGPRPIEEAIVTAGGVSVKEIHPHTMESKIVRGLYFCGEVIDVDGKTGGYNLQAAFSTGWVAGEAAAQAS